MLKTLVLVLIAGTLGGTGHVLLSRGMKAVGDLTEAPSGRSEERRVGKECRL